MVIPLDVALALVAANVITNHTDPAEVDRAADVLRSLECGASVAETLDATRYHSWSIDNPPAFVDSSQWDDPDNG